LNLSFLALVNSWILHVRGKTMKNVSRIEFCDEISGKSTRIRFSDIHNPALRFMHRWIAFTLFPTWEL
jgi:hypothetical protein